MRLLQGVKRRKRENDKMKHHEIIEKMTLEDKIALCSGKDFWHTKDMPQYDLPDIMMCDGPHGLRKQEAEADMLGVNESVPATCFPTAVTTGASWNVDLMQRIGKAIAEEALANQVSIVLGPGANIKRNPLCGRNFEYISEDPYLAGKMAAGFIRGVEEEGVATSLKHFAGNSQETKRFTSDSVIDERTLREIYLTAFEIAVKEGRPSTVMCAYNKINGIHCSDNKELLTDILREEWGFDGMVVTDWGAMNDRIEGFKAGCDLNMPGGSDYMEKDVAEAVRAGRLSESAIDKSADRMIDLILRSDKNLKKDATYDKEKHHALAREAACEGMVLLKNQDRILPIAEGKKVALIGKMAEKIRYQGAGSSHINPTKISQPIDAIAHTAFALGCDERGNTTDALLSEARQAAKEADIAIVFAGLTEVYESEGFDRADMQMPKGHVRMIEAVAEANPNTIVVLMCGSVVECPWADKVKGILYAGLSGQAGAEAIADILYGRVNPSGKLAESWTEKYEDCISAKDYAKEKDALYQEGLYVGYRYYDSAGKNVRFPFGYGLSYTTFSYDDLQIQEMGQSQYRVTCKVTNTGDCPGQEVVQLYVAAVDSKVFRPAKELKAFAKVALEPGQTKEVSMTLDTRSFAIYLGQTYVDAMTSEAGLDKGWILPKGRYNIMIGSSSRKIELMETIAVDGVDLEAPAWQKGSWYETLAGQPDTKEFKKILGYSYVEQRHHKGEFTLEDTVEEMKEESLIMKIMYKATEMVVKKGMGGRITEDNEADFHMMMASSAGSPIRSMMISGGIKGGVMPGMVDMANGHFFRGLGRMMGIVK